ncbi:hypothetical protein HMPREF9554_00580 [Treponema phagedenis F0421]|nr:hypothetical protein HMPREF9554_00580 [Treponema phagedenis F0421]
MPYIIGFVNRIRKPLGLTHEQGEAAFTVFRFKKLPLNKTSPVPHFEF